MNWMTQGMEYAGQAFHALLSAPVVDIGNKRLSLGAIFLLVLLSGLVVIFSRWVSTWIKRGLLERLGLDRGSQEAIASVINYFLIGLGFVIVLQTAGFNLSSLAVLAGVLGIGIGFGLQNLASNFISGLALLFEQPIKVGDFVEVGSLLGTVEKISMRSTVIRTPDSVFVIVPNNRFLENNIINWSYQGKKCRIHIPISVSYGVDPLLITEVLSAVARMEPRVLTHPSPKVWFKSFGESDLHFELLVWIDEPEESDPIKSSLNFLIEQEFRTKGIEIPFPQRELHIKNLDSLVTALRPQSVNDGIPGAVPRYSENFYSDRRNLTTQATNNWTLRVLLRRITYFEGCTDIEIRQLIEHGYRQFYNRGQLVCQENDPGESFYIILSGSVEVYSQRANQYIATLHVGEFFGEISLLTGTPRTATVRSLEDTLLFVIDHNDLQILLKEHQELAEQIAQKLSERQQMLQSLGILDEKTLQNLGETPLSWIRKRLQILFGI